MRHTNCYEKLCNPNELSGTLKQPTYFSFRIPSASSPYSLAQIFSNNSLAPRLI